MKVREIMTANPACCTRETNLQEVARLMAGYDCGQIPVVENKDTMRPVGVVTDRDIACRVVAEGKNPLETSAAECMSEPCITVSPNASLAECCRLMEEHRVRRLPVVDEGRCCGIITQADVAMYGSGRTTAALVKEVSQPTTESSSDAAEKLEATL